jgi:L-aminopeptidase/D-esterase-like protein
MFLVSGSVFAAVAAAACAAAGAAAVIPGMVPVGTGSTIFLLRTASGTNLFTASLRRSRTMGFAS